MARLSTWKGDCCTMPIIKITKEINEALHDISFLILVASPVLFIFAIVACPTIGSLFGEQHAATGYLFGMSCFMLLILLAIAFLDER